MIKYTDMTAQQRKAEYSAVLADYEKQKALGLKLNMARGKPGKEQLDMVTDLCNILVKPEDFICDGIDSRNYAMWMVCPRPRSCLPTYWAANRSSAL